MHEINVTYDSKHSLTIHHHIETIDNKIDYFVVLGVEVRVNGKRMLSFDETQFLIDEELIKITNNMIEELPKLERILWKHYGELGYKKA